MKRVMRIIMIYGCHRNALKRLHMTWTPLSLIGTYDLDTIVTDRYILLVNIIFIEMGNYRYTIFSLSYCFVGVKTDLG